MSTKKYDMNNIKNNLFYNSLRNIFSVIFYFLLLGPAGSLAYLILDSYVNDPSFKVEEKSKNKLSVSNIQSFPIFLGLKKNYFKKNILILGEGLHTIHPVAGQGFNLVLRDIRKLKEILKYYSTLGISLKNSYALNDFYKSRKPENIIMRFGVDLTHRFFKKKHILMK